MAKCDEGYLCDVCGLEVERLIESELYLRYVLGFVPPERLHVEPERHIRCNSALAQFIMEETFEPMEHEGPGDKRELDPAFVASREKQFTQAWRRLHALERSEESIVEYPRRRP